MGQTFGMVKRYLNVTYLHLETPYRVSIKRTMGASLSAVLGPLISNSALPTSEQNHGNMV